MKYITIVLAFSLAGPITMSAQKADKDEVNFSDPFQVDSTDYFLIPKLIDNDNLPEYGKGKGYLPWGNYSDIHFYNTRTNQTKKLFNGQLALIAPFFAGRYYYYAKENERDIPANVLPAHIIYLARTDNYNGDNALDSEDPLYLYISTKTGENLRQLTPKGYHVVSWTISKDKKIVLVKLKNDKNGNKKFGNGDDDLIYRIDLQNDISKIQCYPINM